MMAITDRILTKLQQHGLITREDDWQVTPAKGGLNTRVFFVNGPDGEPALTIRTAMPGREWIFERESRYLEAASRACSYAPSVIALHEPENEDDFGLLVHAFVAGVVAPLDAAAPAELAALGRCLASLHQIHRESYEIWPRLANTSGTRADAFRDRLAALKRYLTFRQGIDPNIDRRIGHTYSRIGCANLQGDGWEDTTFSLLHGDLSAGNILWTGDGVRLIDWEYARYGDPAEEIAYLFAEQPVPQPQVDLVLEAYVRAGGEPASIARSAIYASLVALDSALWWGDYQMNRGEDPLTAPEVTMHLSRAEDALSRVTY